MFDHSAPSLINLNDILTVNLGGPRGLLPLHGRVALHSQVTDMIEIGLTHRVTAWQLEVVRDPAPPNGKTAPYRLDRPAVRFTSPGVRILRLTIDGAWSRDILAATFPYHCFEALGLEALPTNPSMRPTCLRILQRLIGQREVTPENLVYTLEEYPKFRAELAKTNAKVPPLVKPTGIYSSLTGARDEAVRTEHGQNEFSNFIRNVREYAPAQPFEQIRGAA